jgi:hypothetical protein
MSEAKSNFRLSRVPRPPRANRLYTYRMSSTETKARDFGAVPEAWEVDKLVLATVNAPYKRSISGAALQHCLVEVKLDDWPVHVATFFTDVTAHLVFRFADAHGISKSKLADAYLAMKAKTGEQNPALESDLVPLASSAR